MFESIKDSISLHIDQAKVTLSESEASSITRLHERQVRDLYAEVWGATLAVEDVVVRLQGHLQDAKTLAMLKDTVSLFYYKVYRATWLFNYELKETGSPCSGQISKYEDAKTGFVVSIFVLHHLH
jgi:hypothetical protein